MNIGSGGGPAAAAPSGGAGATSGGAAPEAAKVEEKKEEGEDNPRGIEIRHSTNISYRKGRVGRGYGLRIIRLECCSDVRSCQWLKIKVEKERVAFYHLPYLVQIKARILTSSSNRCCIMTICWIYGSIKLPFRWTSSSCRPRLPSTM